RTVLRGVRVAILDPSPQRDDTDPDDNGECHGADDGTPAHGINRLQIKPVAGIPDQMPDAPECVVDKGPRVAEQDDLTDPRAEEPTRCRKLLRPSGRGQQPPSEKQCAEIKRRTGNAM